MVTYDVASYQLVYIYSMPYEDHKGLVKVGMTTMKSLSSIAQLEPNCAELNRAARTRIKQQHQQANTEYTLHHSELALKYIKMGDGSVQQQLFADREVHAVLSASGYRRIVFNESGRDSEWFETDIETAIKAIKAVKEGKKSLAESKPVNVLNNIPKITLRDEQIRFVNNALEWFKGGGKDYLAFCKPRFGKTVSCYELIKRGGFKKVIVLTHMPAVVDGWGTDHDIIFNGTNHVFLDKTIGTISNAEGIIDAQNERELKAVLEKNIPFTYFASVQDLRGSKRVKENGYNKNNLVFDLDWDLAVIDEAHSGLQTELGDAVLKALIKDNTQILRLSGTPYNILQNYQDNVFTWSYVDEQKAKEEWEINHPNEKNPYADLPKMHIYTFDLATALSNSYRFVSDGDAFSFSEFFRVWTGDIEKDYKPIPIGKQAGDFVHEEDVIAFLDLISSEDSESQYPFANETFRNEFKHTFWIVPGVKEAKALSSLMKEHRVFKEPNYHICNIAGDGDAEQPYDEALGLVRDCISEYPKTITISCGKLTTGVTVKEWTGVMMLAGSSSTSAAGYMQTIFRGQNPGIIDGKKKENCYVFDFAPDRTLKVVAEVNKVSLGRNKTDEAAKAVLGEFLNYLPVISISGTRMVTYDVSNMMKQIKRITIEAAVNSGFEDDNIYDSEAGIVLNKTDETVISKLADVVVPQKKAKKATSVIVNNQGLTEEQRKKAESGLKKPKKERTPEEEALIEKLKKQREEQKKLYDLLRAVSIRLPLLFYGAEADITENVKLEDFLDIVDDESWEEFMPRGLKKTLFKDILRFYDADVVMAAGQRIRMLAKQADEMIPSLRAKRIVEIMSKFKNPDKETVLTPWRVVNMHLGKTFGGYVFYEDDYMTEIEEPQLIEKDEVTSRILLDSDVRILEMNSKSGLYPLYMTYSIYMMKVNGKEYDMPYDKAKELWNETLLNNIFVLCKTKMAKSITNRTLAGYSNADVNAICLTHIYERLKDIKRFSNKVNSPLTWGKEGDSMKFTAVCGNPPYQIVNEGLGTGADPVYHVFIDAARQLAPVGTFIHPARFLFNAGKTPKEWNTKMLNDKHYKIVEYWADSSKVFPTVDIKGGVAISYWDKDADFGEIGVFVNDENLRGIMDKVIIDGFESLADIIYPRDLYRLTDELYKENDWAEDRPSKGHKYDVGSNVFETFPELFTDDMPEDGEEYIQILGRESSARKYKWVKRKYIKEPDNFEYYRLFLTKASGTGALGETLPVPSIGKPKEGHSATFLSAGKFNTEFEAQALMKYVKTKFARTMLGTLKVTQNSTREAWRNVPIQDFTENSDIDWTKTIPEIDVQLYDKYSLSVADREFIETNIEPME